ILGKFGHAGKEPGAFSTIHQMDCRNENEIITAEITAWRVQKVTLKPRAMTTNSGKCGGAMNRTSIPSRFVAHVLRIRATRGMSLLPIAAVVLLVSPLGAQISVPDIPYDSTANFLKLPEHTYLGEAAGVATNSKGHVFVYTRTG